MVVEARRLQCRAGTKHACGAAASDRRPTPIMSAAAKTAVGGSVSASIDCIARSALSG
jgi:hypothetical protein